VPISKDESCVRGSSSRKKTKELNEVMPTTRAEEEEEAFSPFDAKKHRARISPMADK